MKEESESAMESFLSGFFKNINREEKIIAQRFLAEEKNSVIVDSACIEGIIDPEHYELAINYPHKRLTNGILKEKGVKTHQGIFIVSQYSFIKSHIETLIVKKDGMSSCADKSKRLIKMYYSYFEHGMPLIECLLPQTVLSSENEALAYFEAIYSLFYGQPGKYIEFHK